MKVEEIKENQTIALVNLRNSGFNLQKQNTDAQQNATGHKDSTVVQNIE